MQILIVLLLLAGFQPNCYAGSDNSQDEAIYFNAGTEKYLKGDYKGAIENLETALQYNPENKKTKDFIVRIYLEAATQKHVAHKYTEAYELLEKAIEIDPENRKVSEMFKLTEEILSSNKEEYRKEERKPVKKKEPEPEPKKPDAVKPAEATPKPQPKEAEKKKYVPEPIKVIEKQQVNTVNSVDVNKLLKEQKEKLYRIITLSAVWGVFSTLMFIITLILRNNDQKMQIKKLSEMQEIVNNSNNEREVLNKNLERTKELLEFEHETVVQLRNEITEVKKREYEKLKMEVSMREKMMKDKTHIDLSKKGPNYNDFIQQGNTDVSESSKLTQDTAEITSPRIEALRERISVMASNLYDTSPQSALEFIKKIANDPNPSVKVNVIPALARIASNETIEILLWLYKNDEYRIKRETLKHINELNKRIVNGDLNIKKELVDSINSILELERNNEEWIF